MEYLHLQKVYLNETFFIFFFYLFLLKDIWFETLPKEDYLVYIWCVNKIDSIKIEFNKCEIWLDYFMHFLRICSFKLTVCDSRLSAGSWICQPKAVAASRPQFFFLTLWNNEFWCLIVLTYNAHENNAPSLELRCQLLRFKNRGI